MSWQESLNEALAKMLREQFGIDAVRVTDFEDDLPSASYCDTCGPDPITCYISYEDSDDSARTYVYYGTFAELLRSVL